MVDSTLTMVELTVVAGKMERRMDTVSVPGLRAKVPIPAAGTSASRYPVSIPGLGEQLSLISTTCCVNLLLEKEGGGRQKEKLLVLYYFNFMNMI